jgi:hypothetical protein
MTAKRTALVLGVAVALVIAFVYIAMLVAYSPKRNRFLIPEGYAGWLCVTFAAPGAPALPIEDGFHLVLFPADGGVVTSTAVEGGKMRDEFYYYVADRRSPFDAGQSLGGGYTVSGGSNPPGATFKFWVSPDARADYARFVADKPDTCGPFPGYKSSNSSVNADVLAAISARLGPAGYLQR